MNEDAEKLLLQDNTEPAVGLLQTLPEAEVARLLKTLPVKWRREHDAVVVRDLEILQGLPEQRIYEVEIWQLGETLRQAFEKKKSMAASELILDACIGVIEDESLGAGREPFFELVAKHAAKRGNERARKAILLGIDDHVVAGHAIKAANIAKLTGVDELVEEVAANTDKAWIRREAKKYLRRTAAAE